MSRGLLLVVLVLLQIVYSSSLQSIRVGQTNNCRKSSARSRCFRLASASIDVLNDTISDLRVEPLMIEMDLDHASETKLGETMVRSTTNNGYQYRDHHRTATAASPRISTSLKNQDGYQKQDNRHDDIVDSIVQHFCRSQKPSDGEGGNNRQEFTDNDKFGGENGRRANVQLPPGWGKTQLALKTLATFCLDGIGPSRSSLQSAIYVTPYLKLVDQVLEHVDRFGALSGVPHSRLIVASQTNRTETCTTSVDEIASFLSSGKNKMPLVICTYQSLPKVGEALQQLESSSIGFGIFDEAHVMEGAGELFGYGLYDSLLPVDNRLFLTATPRRYTESPEEIGVLGSKLDKDGARKLMPKWDARHRRDGVRSFVDESLFGPCIDRRTLRESVEQNVTVPITLCALDKGEICKLLGSSYESVKLQLSKDSMVAFAVQAAFHKLNVSRAVSFHSMNYRAEAFANSAGEVLDNDIAVFTVSGLLSASKREEVLSKAKMAPKSIVANCRVLATGVDDAEWELVVMADPVRSSVAARQMIGRVSRKAPGKERGYVLVPIFMDEENGDVRRNIGRHRWL